MKRITKREWDVILTALNMIAAGDWDENSYGERPDFESIAEKVAERVGPPSAAT